MTAAIGIDLGTTNTVVAAVVDGVAVTLEDEDGCRLLPSVVSFPEGASDASASVIVGNVARTRRLVDPSRAVFSTKPLLGRAWSSSEVQAARRKFPFELVEGPLGSTMVSVGQSRYELTEISAFVLRRARAIAEAALGCSVQQAVITVPANFNDLQRESTKLAGKLAGLEVIRMINEPTAAALAYGQRLSGGKTVCIYDLGRGTFDVTLLDLTTNVFEVLSTAGDTALGGDDFDRLIADRIAQGIANTYGHDPRQDPAAYARILVVAEEMKKELSTRDRVERTVDGGALSAQSTSLMLRVKLTREEFERSSRGLLERTLRVAENSMQHARISSVDVDGVVLVGGSTRMPMIEREVERLFGKPPLRDVHPDEVVAIGAAIQASALTGFGLTDRQSTSVSFDSKPILPVAIEEPTSSRSVVALVARALPQARFEDGSAIPMADSMPLLVDVTPLSLGVELVGGYFDPLIDAGTPVPCEKTRSFTTASDGQTEVSIRVAQGHAPRFDDNTCLGELRLSGLRQAPRGEVSVAVTFELDTDGILNVRARDERTGNETEATMRLIGGTRNPDAVTEWLNRQGTFAVS